MSIIIINNIEYNTYATVEEANKFFAAKYGVDWASIENKDQLLVTATREINKLQFQGFKDIEQELEFPRIYCGEEINPTKDLIACCSEIAYAISQLSSIDGVTPNADKIKTMSVGDTSITYRDGVDIETDQFFALAKPIAKKYLGKFLQGNIRIIL